MDPALSGSDGNGAGRRVLASEPGAVTLSLEPPLGGDGTAAVTRALRQEGLGHRRPLGLDSAWRRAGLLESVDRAP